MKICFLSVVEKDKKIFFDMLRTNLEHEHGHSSDFQSTIGVNICVKHLYDNLSPNTAEQIAKLILWDISPDPFFKWVRPLFYNGAIGSIVLHSHNQNNPEGVKKTISILKEFKTQDFPKYLLILTNSDSIDNDEGNINQESIIELENTANEMGFKIEGFEIKSLYDKKPETFESFTGFWNDLRKFYERIVLDIFVRAVIEIPGNNYDIESFEERYFATLDEFDKSLKKIYNFLGEIGFEHDFQNIFVRIKQGLFSINIFSSVCYYHFPNSDETKFFCLLPGSKEFIGWSNLSYMPKNFLLAVAKAMYLVEGNYDAVVKKQLHELKD
ncbi:MAG: hypothetical protein GY870_13775 [archaeon]|nr:hypothetical protein [archaeon]